MRNVLYRISFNTELEFAAPTELYDDSDGEMSDVTWNETKDDLFLLLDIC